MHFSKKLFWISLFICILSGQTVFAQNEKKFIEASFAASMAITDGAFESTVFLRGGYGLWQQLVVEGELGFDRRRNTTALVYTAAIRWQWDKDAVKPFLLGGGGAETTFVGPFSETRPLIQLGTGLLAGFNKSTFFRAEYRLQRVSGSIASFNRHLFLFGILLRF